MVPHEFSGLDHHRRHRGFRHARGSHGILSGSVPHREPDCWLPAGRVVVSDPGYFVGKVLEVTMGRG